MPTGARDTLVVLSNRLPITLRRERGRLRADVSTGGLVSALRPALHRQGGTWIGWPGTQLKGKERLPQVDDAIELVPVPLSPTEVKRYYHGFSNRTLWPLFHSLPERALFVRREWECYEAVTRRFAAAAEPACRGGQLVWIHDYHLLRTAAQLRERVPEARLAFFLHLPFPPFDLFRLLPWSRALLEGVLACDLIGFHSPGYVSNFLDVAERLLGARVDPGTGQVELGDHTSRVAAFPLGIDYDAYEKRAHSAPRKAPTEQVILGVDRLDYTKGIPERILAFERFLELFPEHRENVVFIQLAVPSRDQMTAYQEQKRSIDEHVGRVNGRFGTSTWTPIRYLYRSVSPERLAALYRDADVALVTPLRDGMNLVAKEYVACQVDDPGVLILSRLAGAAETMREALQVNPYDTDTVALKLHQALKMPLEDRRDRINALQARERRRYVTQWLSGFLAAASGPRSRFRPTTEAEFDAWLGDYLRARPLALFLDYDGTLAPIVGRPEEAVIPDGTLEALRRCASRDDTDITVVSGRSIVDIGARVGLDDITYAGNHGLEIHGPGVPDFVHTDVQHFQDRAEALAKTLRALGVDGALVEEKGASLTFHYRQVPKPRWPDAIAQVEACISEAGFQARGALCAIEARPPIGWDKGHAVLHILRTRYGPSWSQHLRVIYAGDDSTDEDAFRSLQGLGVSFRVGGAQGSTRATRRLPSPDAIYTLLQWLAARPKAPATA